MPVRKVQGGFQYGTHGKVYPKRKDAVKQAQAIFANKYKEEKRRK